MKKKVFIIDDEKDIREIIQVNLKNEGYIVYSFSNAELALAELNKTIPDIIILDIMMDGMDGYEFCKKIRSSDKYSYIPIISLCPVISILDPFLMRGITYESNSFLL